VQERARARHFDVIKLDVEGEEARLLADAPSRAVLCSARCIALELHDRFEPGCTAALDAFLADGCAGGGDGGGGGGERFAHVVTSREYLLYCRESLLQS
jgi:hypothetical protein